jgi:N-hydroxyarylamine O-acetyltransferase
MLLSPGSVRGVFDVDAYVGRVGLAGRPALAELHRAHVAAIPFENLDPHRGVPVTLDEETLARKMIDGGRGGYCFEQNLLFKAALEALGARVEPMLARVRWNAPADAVRPLTHMTLRVEMEGRAWLADVGFGTVKLLEPIPFGPGGPYEQSGWSFRVIEEPADLLVLQTLYNGDWADLYAFTPRPVPQIDIEVSNWFTSTHPRSPFVTGLLVATTRKDGAVVALSDWGELAMVVWTPEGSTQAPVDWDEIPRLLEEQFRLGGFVLGERGRVALAGDQSPVSRAAAARRSAAAACQE